MSRSIWKFRFPNTKSKSIIFKSCHNLEINKTLYNNLKFVEKQKPTESKVWSRSSIILDTDLGKVFLVYNGKSWSFCKIVEKMLYHNHRLGEFAISKQKTNHKLNKKKIVKKK